MQHKTLVRPGATVATLIPSASLPGAGIASANPTESDQPSPPETGQWLEQMDQHMAQILKMLPAERRADAQQMHEQTRSLMEQMMNDHGGMMTNVSVDMGAMMDG